MISRQFKGKILLFGEYSIVLNHQALIAPLELYSGSFEFPANPEAMDATAGKSREHLGVFLEYLMERSGHSDVQLDLDAFGSDLDRGLFFRSSIPENYGVGSSGALIAAIFDRYSAHEARLDENLPLLRKILAEMEGHFHGRSFGIDPLCCYLNKALLVEGESVETGTLPDLRSTFFLLDSRMEGQTSAPDVGTSMEGIPPHDTRACEADMVAGPAIRPLQP